MRRYCIPLALLFLPFWALAQENQLSDIYFNNGKLRADTTLSISAKQFKGWWRAENDILADVAYFLTYPSLASRNGVEGKVIIAFEVTDEEIINVRAVDTSWVGFREAAVLAVQKSSRDILRRLGHGKMGRNYSGTYYIPIEFDLFDFKEETRRRAALPVLKPTEPIVRDLHIEPLIGEK